MKNKSKYYYVSQEQPLPLIEDPVFWVPCCFMLGTLALIIF